jgi:uncharacterized protein YggE
MRPLAALAVLLTVAPAIADDSPPPQISVVGNGEVKLAPDLAVIAFAVETTAREASAAVASNAEKSNTLAAAIKRQLSDNDRVETTRYSLDPIYESRDRGSSAPPRISGYVARNEVRVQTRHTDQVGKMIDAATAAGANRINSLEFTLADRASAHAEALRKAGSDARRQAETIAAALGIRLGRILSASTSGSPVVMAKQYRGMAMAMESAPTPVEPGEVSVDAALNVSFAIE